MKFISFFCLFSFSLYGSSFEEMVDKYQITKIHFLAYYNNLDELKSEINKNSKDLNAIDKYGNTALHYAAYYNRTHVAKLFLNNGAYVDIPNYLGHTPLFLSVLKSNQDTSICLCEYNADIYKSNKNGQTPFSISDANMREIMLTINCIRNK